MSRICSPKTNATNRWYTRPITAAQQAVGPAQLVALHDVDVVGRVLHEELELGGVELPVAVGVEDPLLASPRRSPESSAPP